MVYWLARLILFILTRTIIPLTVVGREHIPPDRRCILASNHRSYLDPCLIGYSLPYRISYIARDSLYESKILGFLLRQLWAYPIRRDYADFRAIRETFRRLKNGHTILIFPEGTRVEREFSKEPEPGIGLIAAKSKVPVIPVYIEGTQKALPPKAKVLKYSPIKIVFGRPVGYSSTDSASVITHKIIEAIYALARQEDTAFR